MTNGNEIKKQLKEQGFNPLRVAVIKKGHSAIVQTKEIKNYADARVFAAKLNSLGYKNPISDDGSFNEFSVCTGSFDIFI